MIAKGCDLFKIVGEHVGLPSFDLGDVVTQHSSGIGRRGIKLLWRWLAQRNPETRVDLLNHILSCLLRSSNSCLRQLLLSVAFGNRAATPSAVKKPVKRFLT